MIKSFCLLLNPFRMEQETVIEQAQLQVGAFMARVYQWMMGALFLSGLAAWFTVNSPLISQLMISRGLVGVLILAELGLVLYLSFAIQKMSVRAAIISFLLYSVLTGVTLSTIFLVYTAASIVRVFAITAVSFGALSVYGATTKRDLNAWGSFLFMALIGLIVASLVNLFLQTHFLTWVTTYAGIIIFAGLTAWDTQKLRYYGTSGVFGNPEKAAIFGALALYLDFINLFLYLLRAMGDRR